MRAQTDDKINKKKKPLGCVRVYGMEEKVTVTLYSV